MDKYKATFEIISKEYDERDVERVLEQLLENVKDKYDMIFNVVNVRWECELDDE